MSTTVRTQPKVLGKFSKAVDDGRSLNFCPSGGLHCDRRCPHHPESTARNPSGMCYAVRCETRPDRSELAAKLARHQQSDPVSLIDRAKLEILRRRRPLRWLRLATNGAMPAPRFVTRRFIRALRTLLIVCREHGTPVHLPIESPGKARVYRRAVEDLVVVRESFHSRRRFLNDPRPCSFVVGRRGQRCRDRVFEALELARRRKAKTGRRTIICPAIASRFLSSDRKPAPASKCGNCTACANPAMDVIYPLH